MCRSLGAMGQGGVPGARFFLAMVLGAPREPQHLPRTFLAELRPSKVPQSFPKPSLCLALPGRNEFPPSPLLPQSWGAMKYLTAEAGGFVILIFPAKARGDGEL